MTAALAPEAGGDGPRRLHPLPEPVTQNRRTRHSRPGTPPRVHGAEFEVQNLSKNEVVTKIRCREASRRDIRDLLHAAFPARSDHAVSQRAARILGNDPRTVRSWMAGRTEPSWTEVRIIIAYATVEMAMRLLFGGRR